MSKVKKKNGNTNAKPKTGGKPAAVLRAARDLPQRAGPMATQLQSLADPLTKQDEAIFGYLSTLSDPWIDEPTGVPLILGSGDVRTTKARTKRLITLQANASGFAFLTVNNDGWERDNPGNLYQYASYPLGVAGNDVWYTDGTYVGTTLPAYTATTATTGLLASAAPLIDEALDANSMLRQVACGIRCWSDAAALVAAGNVRVVSTVDPINGAGEGALPGSTDATLEGISPFIMAQEMRPLPGWRSGDMMSTFAVPTTKDGFEMRYLPAVGSTAFGFPQIGIIITGAAANQTFKVEIAKLFEFEFQQSNRLNVAPEPTVGSDMGVIGNNVAATHEFKVREASPVHEASGIHNGAGPLAFAKNMMVTRPLKIEHLQQAMTKPTSSLAPLIQSGVSWLAKRARSYLPGIVNKAIRFFGF
jgi:hypothetical protein